MSWQGKVWDKFYIGQPPWDIGSPRPELEHLVESGRLVPCQAIDLGCGTGDTVLYLATRGFDVTGVDISTRAIAIAREKARLTKVPCTFLVADVTNLKETENTFGLVVDNGCLHSLQSSRPRDRYVDVILRLTGPGSFYFLRCFTRKRSRFFYLPAMIGLDEVEQRFGQEFDIEEIQPLPPESGRYRFSWLRQRLFDFRYYSTVYLMSRKNTEP
jgi:SAM-dependent methyltransferase